MRERFVAHTEATHQSARGRYLGDVVYGANDGIITTFAVVAGVAGAELSSGIAIILGLANLVADGISMGLSNYLATRSRGDFERHERKREEDEVERFPDVERTEVADILARWGVPDTRIPEVVAAITKDKKRWVDLMMREELGIHEKIIDSPLKHGAVTFASFLIAGAMPLIPYLFSIPAALQLETSVIATAASLFAVGALRTWVTAVPWLRSGMQMLGVGGLAAAAAYLVGAIVKSFFGVSL